MKITDEEIMTAIQTIVDKRRKFCLEIIYNNDIEHYKRQHKYTTPICAGDILAELKSPISPSQLHVRLKKLAKADLITTHAPYPTCRFYFSKELI